MAELDRLANQPISGCATGRQWSGSIARLPSRRQRQCALGIAILTLPYWLSATTHAGLIKVKRASQAGASQYVSIPYSERLAEAGIEPSAGSKGDSYDNALAETINGLYNAELIHRCGPWKIREAVEIATLEWVAWFNHHRLLEPLGYIPPAEAEANYYRQLSAQATHA